MFWPISRKIVSWSGLTNSLILYIRLPCSRSQKSSDYVKLWQRKQQQELSWTIWKPNKIAPMLLYFVAHLTTLFYKIKLTNKFWFYIYLKLLFQCKMDCCITEAWFRNRIEDRFRLIFTWVCFQLGTLSRCTNTRVLLWRKPGRDGLVISVNVLLIRINTIASSYLMKITNI